MDYVLNGQRRHLTVDQVVRALVDVQPEPLREYGVRVGGRVFPVKQAFSVASGLPRREFTSQSAARILERLSFEILGGDSARVAPHPPKGPRPTTMSQDGRMWPWEGSVQDAFVTAIEAAGWSVTSAADTATKARGVDVLARKRGERWLGAEVKGWPGRVYADPRRAHEVKPTHPTNQAGHWFSQALFKALMLLDSHPGYESLVVLPDDFSRYHDLARRTRTGRAAAGVHVVFVNTVGGLVSDTWGP